MSVDTNNAAFQDARNLIQNITRQSVFLTGKAGTGKSTFLRYVCEHTRRNMSFSHLPASQPSTPEEVRCTVSSNSPLLSVTAGRSEFKSPEDAFTSSSSTPNRTGSYWNRLNWSSWTQKSLWYWADLIDAIDRILRVYSHNLQEPFGGKQLLLVGDVFQLEPVVK